MCGRITTVEWDELLAVMTCFDTDTPFNAYPDWPAIARSYVDAFPRREVPLICSSKGSSLEATKKIWGYEPNGHTDLVFNTRIENADVLPLWKSSFEERHCIVPVHAFYEPHGKEHGINDKGKEVKQQYRFTELGSPIMLLCGIWKDDRFSIMTKPPDKFVKPVHHRMPVIMDEREAIRWLALESLVIKDDVPLERAPLYPPLKSESSDISTPEQERLF